MKKPILCTGGALRVCCVMVTDEAVGAWCVSDDLAQLLVMVHVTWAATGATSRANGGAPGGSERQLFDASKILRSPFSTCDERAAARASGVLPLPPSLLPPSLNTCFLSIVSNCNSNYITFLIYDWSTTITLV